jgi:hypothetical protein
MPLALQQLVTATAVDLQLGPSEKAKLDTALVKAFAMGMTHAAEVMEKAFNERTKSKSNANRS